MELILTLDVGTTSVKACLFDRQLRQTALTSREYALQTRGVAAHLVPPIKSATATWSSRIMPKSTMCRAALMAQASAVVFMVSAM